MTVNYVPHDINCLVVAHLQMFSILALSGEGGRAEVTKELNHLTVFLDMFLEVGRVAELPVAVRTSEPRLVGVGHQVVVQTVLPGERCAAKRTLEWPEASVTPEIDNNK